MHSINFEFNSTNLVNSYKISWIGNKLKLVHLLYTTFIALFATIKANGSAGPYTFDPKSILHDIQNSVYYTKNILTLTEQCKIYNAVPYRYASTHYIVLPFFMSANEYSTVCSNVAGSVRRIHVKYVQV